jgi:hypothetical protein
MRREILCYLVIALVATVVCAPLLVFGAPYGYDIAEHLSWLERFAAQLRAGELYPRWLVDLNGGAGSPTFFYYVPFAYYVSAIFGGLLCPGCGTSAHMGVGMWLMILASGVAFFVFARQYGRPWIATLGALAYMVLPYHFEIDLWRRLAFTEIAAYIWMPLILLWFQRSLDDRRFVVPGAVGYALLVVSHVPSAMIFGLFLGGYAFMECVRRREARPMLYLWAAAGLGIALSAVYLVPAALAEKYVFSPQMFVSHESPPGQLWTYEYFDYRNWMFLDGRLEPNDGLTKHIFAVLLATTGVFALLCGVLFRTQGRRALRALAPWLFGVAFVWLMVSPLSIPLWEAFPPLKKIQFPFRFVIVADLALAVTIVLAVGAAAERRDRVSYLALAAATALLAVTGFIGTTRFFGIRPVQNLLEPLAAESVIENTAAQVAAGFDPIELFMPVWVGVSAGEFRDAIGAVPRARIEPAEDGDAQVARWRPRDIVVDVETSTDTVLAVKQFYFPGWRATDESSDEELPVSPSEPLGLLLVEVPRGEHSIALRLEPLWQERAGYAVSALALAILLAMVYIDRRRRRASAPAEPESTSSAVTG